MSHAAKIAGIVPTGVRIRSYSSEYGQRKHKCKYRAGQGVKDPKSGDHLACAVLFSNAKYEHRVFISYMCQIVFPIGVSARHRHLPSLIPLLKEKI